MAKSGDLVANPLSYTAARIKKEIERVTNEYVESMIDFFKNQDDLKPYQDLYCLGTEQRAYYTNPNLEVVSWLGMPTYSTNFGWGNEIYMGPGKHAFDGDIVVLPGPDGDGSLVVSCCLQEAHMEAFKNFFYEDLLPKKV